MGPNGMNCATSVALFVFNRPGLAARVFEAIRKARPPRLFLIADGPRHAEDEPKCEASQALAEQVDWDCEVLTNFSETNLGCGHRVASGLDWVFARTNEAIILEDDCVPVDCFFNYCDELLAHYRNDRRVMHIGGSSFLPPGGRCKHSYYFSKYASCLGWASWRRAWQHYSFGIPKWPEFKRNRLELVCPDRIEAAHWVRRLDPIARGERSDVWDYQWSFSLWEQKGFAVVPTVNLISYIGVGDDATHSKKVPRWHNRPLGSITDLVHPPAVAHDAELDRITFDEFYGGARMRRRATLSYQLAKPLRLLRAFQARFTGARALASSDTVRLSS
jgi:hypothetical protein